MPSTLPPRRIGQLRHPRRNLQIQHRQPEQNSDFHHKSYSSGLDRSATSSPEEDDDAPALDSNTGLAGLSIGVGVDRHRRTKKAGRNYSPATPSLPRREKLFPATPSLPHRR